MPGLIEEGHRGNFNSGFSALFSLNQHAGMPLIVFGVNVAEPLIALYAVHGRREVAGFVRRGDSLALPIRAVFLLV